MSRDTGHERRDKECGMENRCKGFFICYNWVKDIWQEIGTCEFENLTQRQDADYGILNPEDRSK